MKDPKKTKNQYHTNKNTNISKDNLYHQREITKNGKRKRYVSYRPQTSLMKDLLAIRPQDFYRDQDGRLYVIVQDKLNPRYNELFEKGVIDDEETFLLVIWLPNVLKGSYVKDRKDELSAMSNLSSEEILNFPEPDSTITLYSYVDEGPQSAIVITVMQYPERISRKSKTSFAICLIE